LVRVIWKVYYCALLFSVHGYCPSATLFVVPEVGAAVRLDQFIATCVSVSLQRETLDLRRPEDRAGGSSGPEAAEPVVEARKALCRGTTLVPGRG